LLISSVQLLLEPFDLLFLVGNQPQPRVLIYNRHIADVLGPTGILQGGNVLIQVVVEGGETRDHQGVRVASQRLPQNGGQLRFPIGYVGVLAATSLRQLSVFCKGTYYLPQGKE